MQRPGWYFRGAARPRVDPPALPSRPPYWPKGSLTRPPASPSRPSGRIDASPNSHPPSPAAP